MKNKMVRKFLVRILALVFIISLVGQTNMVFAANVSYKVTYANPTATAVTLHWGINGWTGTTDTVMTANGGGNFSVILSIAQGSTLNYCYHVTSPTDYWDNNSGSNWSVVVNASNVDTVAPTISLTAPAAGATVSGTSVPIDAVASDNVGVAKVEFYAGTTKLGVDVTSPPFSMTWDTTNVLNGTYSLTAKAYDAAGNVTTSAARSVTVNNPTSLINYAIRCTKTNVSSINLHWGVNGWTNVVDSPMTNKGSGVFEYIVTVPKGTVVNYCFHILAPSDYWDNNSGSNWSVTVTATNIENVVPTTSITSPTTGSTLSNTVTVSANASDGTGGVTKVEFYVGTIQIGEDTTSPYSVSWNTRTQANGTCSLTSKAYDAAGNIGTSAPVSVTVNNTVDTLAPTVSISAPAAGATVSGTTTISANANDNVAVAKVEFYAGNALVGEDTTSPYSVPWYTNTENNGTFVLTAKAYDTSGNVGTSGTVSVTVNNTVTSSDFRSESIYFLLTTRFYDGDSNNNYYNRDRIKNGDPQWRGDFKGLIEKLDYLKDLGFTAIWITPPVENRSGLDYHGYHAYDWTKIDPRLESTGATYQDLINAAHAKGMKIIQDVVINHSSNYGIRGKVWIDRLPIKYYRKSGMTVTPPYTNHLGDYKSTYREDNDNTVAPDWFRARQITDALGVTPLVDPKTGTTVPLNDYDSNRFFGTDNATLNTTWYHTAGFIAGGDWESPIPLQTKHMAGDCIDLNTENSVVLNYINSAVTKYLDMGVDAIRVDTAKHVERSNLLQYVNAWKAHKPNLFVFGEVLVKGTGWGNIDGSDNGPSDIRPWWYTRLGTDKTNPNSGGDSGFSVLDFSLFSTFRDNLSKGSFGGIGTILSRDWVYGDATKLVTFLQNHDVGPDNDFKYRFKGDQYMAANAYNLLWTIRGIPCLYYGEEIEFQKGLPQDISGNSDTLDMTGRAYYGDNITSANIAATQAKPLYKHIQRLNLIRKTIPALQKANMSNVNEWGNGMSFTRDYNNGQSYVAVGLSIGGDQSITINNVRNGTYKDAVTGNTITVSNGSITFTVKGNSAGIYVLNGPGKIGTDGTYLR
ncbi:MAG: Ig-like domain-containing protein [Clostridia bacterium]|nr:Ig-like domain-containing protein [Clostridia bacterium]